MRADKWLHVLRLGVLVKTVISLHTWRGRGAEAVARYQRRLHEGLTAAEEFCISSTAADGATLDIGVGAGRTTAVSARKYSFYVGVDYSPEMLRAAQIFLT
jgi:SAM-dependent methyltransferase